MVSKEPFWRESVSLFKTRFKGCCALVLAIVNILIMSVPFFSIVLVKLLLPVMAVRKSCGAGLVISSMGSQLKTLLDVTIDYQVNGDMTIWKLFSGQVQHSCKYS